jgi:chromosome segregation ATPase
MSTSFCAAQYASELEASGVDRQQAAVHARTLEALATEVAYARDLTRLEDALRHEIRQSEERMGARMDAMYVKLSARISEVETTLTAKVEGLRAEFNALRSEFNALRSEFNALRTEVTAKIDAMKAEFVVLRWAIGALAAVSLTTLGLVLKIALA